MSVFERIMREQYRQWLVLFLLIMFIIFIPKNDLPENFKNLKTATSSEKSLKNHPTNSKTNNAISPNNVKVSLPKYIKIPKINLNASFGKELGIKSNMEIEVPDSFTSVGWYKYSPLPGEIGPAIVLGHVDNKTGPAVFYSIGQLEVGDEIIIVDKDDRELVFVVDKSETYEQDSFPTELVYGDLDYPGLRLVTCSGWYNKKTKRYSKNRVVFAHLK